MSGRREERWVQAPDGAALYVVEIGPPEAPPLVLLHGGPAAHHDYLLPAFATLAGKRRLILYDQRGGGRSRTSPSVDLSYPRHVQDLGTVMDALGMTRADVAGYSFGGLWAMLFAARYPGRVDRLLLVSSIPPHHGFRPALDRALAAGQARPAVLAERKALEDSGMRDAAPEEYRRRRFALSVAGYFVDHRLAHALTPFRVQARAAEAVKQSLGPFDFRQELGAIAGARTLVVHGENDPLDISFARDTAVLLGARMEAIPLCGHVPYVEAPEPFFAILGEFLGGHR
ncbi:MAG: alpha/beta fold hydrolase [Deltaproteobacteria bacterium]|nr:alpha/beta fold hydrolase [Deltaproteobacteria bacterium]